MQARVQGVYRSVIDELIGGVKHDFLEAGIDEAVLDELRVSWEAKLSQSGALEATAYAKATDADKQRLAAAGLQGVQEVSRAQQKAARPAAAAAAAPAHAPPASARPRAQQPSYPGYSASYPSQLPPGVQPYRASADRSAYPLPGHMPQQAGNAFLQPQHLPAPMQQPITFRSAQLPGGAFSPHSFPQQQQQQQHLQQHQPQHQAYLGSVQAPQQQPQSVPGSSHIPQQDGPGDDQPAAKTGQPKKKKAKLDAAPAEPAPAASDSESELASEPGDRLSDVELGDEEDVFSPTAPEADAPHKVLCLFDSVKRIKTRWKCQFKDIVMNVHGQDLLFTSAAADFTFQ